MKRAVMALAVMGLAAALTGCKDQPVGPGVGVLDLDKVAAALGWDATLNQSIKDKDQELSDSWNTLRDNLKGQIESKAKEYGEAATDEQKTELGQMTGRADQVLQNAMNEARQKSAVHRQSLVNDFRDKVRPYAKEVADARNIGVIVLKTEPVYYTALTADLTDAVIAKLQAAGPEKTGIGRLPAEPAPAAPAND
ncbi:MAG: Outer membrane protein (OmpH-like) [Lentisphaerae bacterium ADurb.BinA184]|nr:MAG: Outer membrane protein (OmpH-like) [Lentisphaerae bacterium ADurb.BinA184]